MRINLPVSYEEVIERYQELKAVLKEDSVDYSTYTASVKRKRPAVRNSRGGKSGCKPSANDEDYDINDEDWTNAKRKRPPVRNFRGGKSGREPSADDEDDDIYDEDWTSAVRRLSYSTRRCNSSRRGETAMAVSPWAERERELHFSRPTPIVKLSPYDMNMDTPVMFSPKFSHNQNRSMDSSTALRIRFLEIEEEIQEDEKMIQEWTDLNIRFSWMRMVRCGR
ncbi:hypothetical protein NE237_006471 [Protea cynaroides]|uniref:Uncharacterized protein n=1 Tax=Protea cynaroides TaxID=273540 RepID=A0A9Q0KMF5_9MAGN|nr:hypothetical protein NE237_006471 [Protea cynaroides]